MTDNFYRLIAGFKHRLVAWSSAQFHELPWGANSPRNPPPAAVSVC